MARLHKLSLVGVVLLAVYVALLYDVFEQDYVSQERIRLIPVWAVVSLATYVFMDLITGVLGVGDASQAAEELKQDIQAAKADLQKKGVKVE